MKTGLSNVRHAMGIALVLGVVGLAACGDNSETAGAPVSEGRVRQSLTANTTNLAETLSRSLKFLENSELFNDGFKFAFGGDQADTDCGGPVVGPPPGADDEPGQDMGGEGMDDMGGCPLTEEEAVDTDLSEQGQQVADFLTERVFVDGNVERREDTKITYLLRGAVMCTDLEDAESREGCNTNYEKAQLRLVVTSPAEGDLHVKVLLGPARHNPVDVELFQNHFAAEANLAGVKAAAEFLQAEFAAEDDGLNLPETMQGRVRVQLGVEGEDSAVATLSVLEAILVAGQDIDLRIAQAVPGVQITADGAAQTIKTVVTMAAVTGSAKVTPGSEGGEGYFDEEGNWVESEPAAPQDPYTLALELGGLTLEALLNGQADAFTLTGMGLGDTTSKLKVDDKTILALDLNENDGRKFDLTVTKTEDGAVETTFGPAFDLKLAVTMAEAAGKLGEMADWMLDEVIHVRLDGADAPKLRTSEGGVEVLAGKLLVEGVKSNISHTVEAGMCMMPVEREETFDVPPSVCEEGAECPPAGSEDGGMGEGPGMDEGSEMGEEGGSHPLENMEVGTCG